MARRHSDDAPAALTDEEKGVIIDAIVKAERDKDKAHDDFKSANGVYRAALKHAKKSGMDQESIADALKLRKRDPEELKLKFRNTIEYLKLLGVPLGHQLTLGDWPLNRSDDNTAANVSTPADGTGDEAKATAYHQGEKAGAAGENLSKNPYNRQVQFVLHENWAAGWNDAQAALTREMTAGAGKSGDAVKKPRGRRPKAADKASATPSGNGQDTAATEGRLHDANQRGVQAGLAGEPLDSNPFDPDRQAEEYDYWKRGHHGGATQRSAEQRGQAGTA